MELIEMFINRFQGNKVKALTEEQLDELFEFDLSAGFRGTRAEWEESHTSCPDTVAEERYLNAREAGYKGSLKEYKAKVLKR